MSRIILLFILLIIVFLYNDGKKTLKGNTISHLDPLDRWVKSIHWTKHKNNLEYGKVLKLIAKLKKTDKYDEIERLCPMITNNFQAVIHSLANGKDITLFNKKLNELEDILAKYLSINNNLLRLSNKLSPITTQSPMHITSSLEEQPNKSIDNLNWSWRQSI